MRTLKIAALVCFLAAPIFAQKKSLPIGKVTTARDTQSAATDNTPQTVKVMAPIQHEVRRGENLYRIARRYGVTVGEIRSQELNPALANRKNKNLLLRGETINIPVYRFSGRVIAYYDLPWAIFDYTDKKLVTMAPKDAQAMAVALREKDKEIEKLQQSVNTAKKRLFNFGVATLIFAALSFFLGCLSVKLHDEKQALKKKLAEDNR